MQMLSRGQVDGSNAATSRIETHNVIPSYPDAVGLHLIEHPLTKRPGVKKSRPANVSHGFGIGSQERIEMPDEVRIQHHVDAHRLVAKFRRGCRLIKRRSRMLPVVTSPETRDVFCLLLQALGFVWSGGEKGVSAPVEPRR